jgi:hypothetical protein
MTTDERRAEMRELVGQALSLAAASTGWGPDTYWFCSDGDAHIGVFNTAGIGPIPECALRAPEGHVAVWAALEDLGNRKLDLYDLDSPAAAVAEYEENAFREVGLFSFDYSGIHAPYSSYRPHQPYHLRDRPSVPLDAKGLAEDARAYLSTVRFRPVCYADVDRVVVELAFDRVHRPTLWD